MDSKEQSDALWIVIRDAVQLLNVAYLWKVPVDEQWRMSYQELTERINKLSGRPETPEGEPPRALLVFAKSMGTRPLNAWRIYGNQEN